MPIASTTILAGRDFQRQGRSTRCAQAPQPRSRDDLAVLAVIGAAVAVLFWIL
jgi:hypothetical protein